MKANRFPLLLLLAGFTALPASAAQQLTVSAQNPMNARRPSQTIELSAQALAPLGETNLQRIHVLDSAGAEVLCQAIDTDFDAYRRPDMVIFQADFAPAETKRFKVVAGAKQVYKLQDFKAHGRFVRERFDDFAWENDRIAHRMYGKGLETWAGEPLTSSTVDIWSKRVPDIVIDQWYMVDDYHADSGQGADWYSAGPSRGCGGNGLWSNNQLWVSKNFVDSRVLANGPIRVMFELVYEEFDVAGTKVSEVKRITLDAGSQLDKFQSTYSKAVPPMVSGVGLKRNSGKEKVFNKEQGWLAAWEKVAKSQGQQGLAVIADPASIQGEAQDKLNNLVLVKCSPENVATYWAGFCWDKAGQYKTFAEWQAYLAEFAAGLRQPIVVKVTSD